MICCVCVFDVLHLWVWGGGFNLVVCLVLIDCRFGLGIVSLRGTLYLRLVIAWWFIDWVALGWGLGGFGFGLLIMICVAVWFELPFGFMALYIGLLIQS